MAINSSVAVALACMLAVPLTRSANATDAELGRVKANLLSYLTGAEVDRKDAGVTESLKDVEQSTQKALASIRADGGWGDIDYTPGPDQEARLSSHLDRIETLALGFAMPGQSFAGSSELVQAAEKAFRFIRPLVGVDCAKPGNWWYWQIAMPGALGETLLLLEGQLQPGTVGDVEATMRYLLMEDALDAPRPSQAGYWHRTLLPAPGSTEKQTHLHVGQNRIWVAMNHLYLALLTDDLKRAEVVREAFADEVRVQQGEGIQEDYSFHQHGPLLYTGGYGRGFTEDVAEYIWITRGTHYQIPSAGLDTFAGYVLDGAAWSIYGNYYDPSVRGREITRGNDHPMEVPLSLLVLANVPNPRCEEATGVAKSFHEINPSYRMQNAPLWMAIKNTLVKPSLPRGHRHYWESDYTVHRGTGFFASLRMWSNRTKPAELINGEGLNSWHLADGLLWVLLRGGDYSTHDVLPTLDWLRLPGTTVERRQLKPAEGYEDWPPPAAKRTFVGGAFTDKHGVSAMELAAAASPLTAHKSWFFFDDEVVCLGSDIACPTDHPTETIVNQWPLTEAGALLTVDGAAKVSSVPWTEELRNPQWAQCDGIGYLFPEPGRAKAQRIIQSGTWRSMTEMGSRDVHQNPFLTFWFDHGAQAKGATYAYAVVPNKTAGQMQAYSESEPISIVAHTSTVHAVRHNKTGAAGIVFWGPGSVGKVSADRACIVLCEETAKGLTLAVSDPTHEAATFHVTISEQLAVVYLPVGVSSAAEDGKAVVTCHSEKGRNYVARFAR
jgi:chondroitin AC lyase